MVTSDRPLRVAIIGAGPAGFYTAEHLQKRTAGGVHVDMFDRLPTPYGLVRGGVAPDHQKIKSVTKIYDRIASHHDFRYFGGVEIGLDVAFSELAPLYDAVVVTIGAPNDRQMGIEGEDLPGSLSATDFVGWYNGHPDRRDLAVDLSVEHAVVVGNGNVAIDVARILVRDVNELKDTDIAQHALDALRESSVRSVTMLGRRGPAQAAFTPKELRELGELQGVTLVVDPDDLIGLDPAHAEDEDSRRVLEALHEVAGRTVTPGERQIMLRFLTSPVALTGSQHVEAVTVVRNELVTDGGVARAVATDDTSTLQAGLVLRAVGYRGQELPGLPFDGRRGVIPNDQGRVIDPRSGETVVGVYVAGWIKRGPQGVIGTNKQDAGETVGTLLEDFAAGRLFLSDADSTYVSRLVAERTPHVDWDGWKAIDQAEVAAGASSGRPRIKITDRDDMLRQARIAG